MNKTRESFTYSLEASSVGVEGRGIYRDLYFYAARELYTKLSYSETFVHLYVHSDDMILPLHDIDEYLLVGAHDYRYLHLDDYEIRSRETSAQGRTLRILVGHLSVWKDSLLSEDEKRNFDETMASLDRFRNFSDEISRVIKDDEDVNKVTEILKEKYKE